MCGFASLCLPPHVCPLSAAAGSAARLFTHTNLLTAVPVAYALSAAPGLVFSHLSDGSLGHMFALPSASSLGFHKCYTARETTIAFCISCTPHYLYFSIYSYCSTIRL